MRFAFNALRRALVFLEPEVVFPSTLFVLRRRAFFVVIFKDFLKDKPPNSKKGFNVVCDQNAAPLLPVHEPYAGWLISAHSCVVSTWTCMDRTPPSTHTLIAPNAVSVRMRHARRKRLSPSFNCTLH